MSMRWGRGVLGGRDFMGGDAGGVGDVDGQKGF
jgi:hypothetical protein